MGFLLAKLLPPLLMPLGLGLLLQLAGLLGWRRRWGRWLVGAGLGMIWLASLPPLARALMRGLEQEAARLTPDPLPQADVVVVLGGGLLPALPPRRGVEVGQAGDRLLHGVELLRRGKAPRLLLSGGRVSFREADPAAAEAYSAQRLARWLGVPGERIVLSPEPRNTAEEARALASLARAEGWRTAVLVTSASHMPRALASFRRLTDLRITPAACDYQLAGSSQQGQGTAASLAMDLLPRADALAMTDQALRERLGQLVYRLRGWS